MVTSAQLPSLIIPRLGIRILVAAHEVILRIASRGMIKEGNWADVVIFDYDKIQDNATYEKPMLVPTGIDYVLVNGQVVMENGKHTGAKPGRIIYGAGRQIQ